jgi:aminoglycoside phosphotransferase (APT) family kinase protein
MAVTSCRARTLSPLRGVSARLVSGGLERWRRRDTGPSFVDPLQRESLIPALSAEAAREVAAALLGCPVNAATQVPASAEHQVFRIERDDVIAFLKVADAAHLKPELAVLQLLSGRGVPVPVIEAADPDGGRTGFSCVVIRDVGGVPLSHDCAEFAGIGPLLRQVHDVTLGGFGFLIATAGGLIGQDGTWHDAMRQRIQGLELVGEAGLAEPALLARAVAAVDDRIGRLDTPEPGRLIHGDFHPRHVYAADGRVTGIIDWGDASCGDPLYDFGRILHSATVAGGVGHGITVVSQVRQAYGDAPWLQADPTESLLVYAVVFTLAAMHSEFAGGSPWPPWWPAQAAALAAILGALDS